MVIRPAGGVCVCARWFAGGLRNTNIGGVNDTWRKTYSAAIGDYSDVKVVALAQNVTVPFGTIACYYAEGYDSNSLEDKIWYNDANMMVKQIEYDQVGINPVFVDYTLVLVSFTP